MKKSKLVKLLRENYVTYCYINEIKPRSLVKTLTLGYLQNAVRECPSATFRLGAKNILVRRNKDVTGMYITENPKIIEKENFNVVPLTRYEIRGTLAAKRNEQFLVQTLGNYCRAFFSATIVTDPIFRRLVPTTKREKLLSWEHLLFKLSQRKHGYILQVYTITYHPAEYEVVPINYLLENKFGEYIIA